MSQPKLSGNIQIIAGSLESANSSILAAQRGGGGKKSGFYDNELGQSQ